MEDLVEEVAGVTAEGVVLEGEDAPEGNGVNDKDEGHMDKLLQSVNEPDQQLREAQDKQEQGETPASLVASAVPAPPATPAADGTGGGREAGEVMSHVLEYLQWLGLKATVAQLQQECQLAKVAPSSAVSASSLSLSSAGVRAQRRACPEDDLELKLLQLFDEGDEQKFFELFPTAWGVRVGEANDAETETLQFLLKVFFVTEPLRRGRTEGHPPAMSAFRVYLESCPPLAPHLLPLYALPHVPDPMTHASFQHLFQESWVLSLRSRLKDWLKRVFDPLPALITLVRRASSRCSSTETLVGAAGAAAEARWNYRTVRRRLNALQEDYHRLLGVAMELTSALEKSVGGGGVDLEATLEACTHAHPSLFSPSLGDVQAPPTSILLQTMHRRRLLKGSGRPVVALDFGRVRRTLAGGRNAGGVRDEAAGDVLQETLLLLQALRQRVTRVTQGGTRQAVVAAYVRNDVLGVGAGGALERRDAPLNDDAASPSSKVSSPASALSSNSSCNGEAAQDSSGCWTRLGGALTASRPSLLGQMVARFVSALASFPLGRSYLARSWSVSDALFQVLREGRGDATTQDLSLAALQKLSVRGDIQDHLISAGCVEWVCGALTEEEGAGGVAECSTALLFNLCLRSAGRTAAARVAPRLLAALTKLLEVHEAGVVPYVTGALYSLLTQPGVRQEAHALHLDATWRKMAQATEDSEHRGQLEYLLSQLARPEYPTPPATPPHSPHHLQEVPEFLEEELDAGDPVIPHRGEEAGEALLEQRYALQRTDFFPVNSPGPTRSAPAVSRLESGSSWRLPPRPYSDALLYQHSSHPAPQGAPLQQPFHSGWSPAASTLQWSYPQEQGIKKNSSSGYSSLNSSDFWRSSNSLQQHLPYHGNAFSSIVDKYSLEDHQKGHPPHHSPFYFDAPPPASDPTAPPNTSYKQTLREENVGSVGKTAGTPSWPPASLIRRAEHESDSRFRPQQQIQLIPQNQRNDQLTKYQQQQPSSPYNTQQRVFHEEVHRGQQQYEGEDERYPTHQQTHQQVDRVTADDVYLRQQRQQQRHVMSPRAILGHDGYATAEQEERRRGMRQQPQHQQLRPSRQEKERRIYSPEETEQLARTRAIFPSYLRSDKREPTPLMRYHSSDEESENTAGMHREYKVPGASYQKSSMEGRSVVTYSSSAHGGVSPAPPYGGGDTTQGWDMQREGHGPTQGGRAELKQSYGGRVQSSQEEETGTTPRQLQNEQDHPVSDNLLQASAEEQDRPVETNTVKGPAPGSSQQPVAATAAVTVENHLDAISGHLTKRASAQSTLHHAAQGLRDAVHSMLQPQQQRPTAPPAGTRAPNPDTDPLLRSLPPPTVKEYVAIFTSRPRVMRTPPDSAVEERRASPIPYYADPPESPRRVLPPISKTNKSYARERT